MNPQNQVDSFVETRKDIWDELAQLSTRGRNTQLAPAQISRQAELYRELCRDIVRAQRIGCAPTTLSYLDALISRTHSQIYAEGSQRLMQIGQSFSIAFPRALRLNWNLFLLANVLFWIPFIICLERSLHSEAFATRVVPLEMLQNMAQAYQAPLGSNRTGGSSASMAGFYVFNNIGIAFRCFATGILFGLGSVFFLVHNGAVTGAVVGHVIRVGGGSNILTFMCGHAPLELGAIVISGAAGLQMGRALVVTEGRTRLASLGACRDSILIQILGAAAMLLGAALIEAFWSPSSTPSQLKWAVSATMFLLTVFYFSFAGRKITEKDRGTDPRDSSGGEMH